MIKLLKTSSNIRKYHYPFDIGEIRLLFVYIMTYINMHSR